MLVMDIKSNLKTGDVLHCQGHKLLARTIRKVIKSRLSHTAIVIRMEGRLFVADSQREGVNLRSFDEWQRKYKYKFFVSRFGCSSSIIEEKFMRERMFKTLGIIKYDYASLLIHQPIYLLTGKWPRKKPHKENKRFYCSQFVAYVLGIENSHLFSPQDLLVELRKKDCYHEYYPMGDIF